MYLVKTKQENGHVIKVHCHCCLNYGFFRNTPARAQAGAFFGKEWWVSGMMSPSSLGTIILFARWLLALSALRSRLWNSWSNSSDLHSNLCRTSFSSLGIDSSSELSVHTHFLLVTCTLWSGPPVVSSFFQPCTNSAWGLLCVPWVSMRNDVWLCYGLSLH